jgi:hypothetical protein
MDFPRFNFQKEIPWTGSTVHGPGGALWSTVGWVAARIRGMAARGARALEVTGGQGG